MSKKLSAELGVKITLSPQYFKEKQYTLLYMLYSARVVSQKDSLGFTVYLRAPFRTPLCYRNLADPFSILFLLQGKEERPSRLYRFVVLSFEFIE